MEILVRIVQNLINVTPANARLPYLDLLVIVDPANTRARFDRSHQRIQDNDYTGAIEDINWLLETNSPEFNQERLQQFREQLQAELN